MTEPEETDTNRAVKLSAVEIQQEYYEAMGDTDWELYENKDRRRLLQKIAIALCGPPTEEGDLADDQPELKLQGYDARSEEITMQVFKKICEQEKYSHNGENILISIIRVVCVAPRKDIPFYKREPRDYWVDLHTKKEDDVYISIFHVFSLRKCIAMQPGVKSCKVFIDHDARVYKDWESYLAENLLPKSVMVVPEDGEYKGVIQNTDEPLTYDNFVIPRVKLNVVPSPALGIGAKILSVADTTSTVASIGAMIGTVGVMVTPAAPIVVGTVLAVGAVTSVYGIVRSSIHLADRGNHEQSISLFNSESRASWLNILVSTAGLSLSAAGKMVAWAASSGTNIKILINAFQFLKYTTIASGILGLVNGFGEMIYNFKKYSKKPTKLELFQFTSSLLFFGIGVMSNQTAQEIVEDSQAKSINKIRDSLTSNAKRKMFDKITAETRRVQGSIQGNADVIKGLTTITNKNEFFAKLSKMNKELNANKLRISLGSDGSTLINNQHQMTLSKLTELGKTGRGQLFRTMGPAKVTTKNVPTRIYQSSAMASQMAATRESFISNIRPEEVLKIASFINTLCQRDKDFLCELLSEISEDVHQTFILLCIDLINFLIPAEIDYFLSFLGPSWKIRVIYYAFDYFKSQTADNNDDAEFEMTFGSLLKEFFAHGKVRADTLKKLRDMLMTYLSEEINREPGPNCNPRKFDGLYELRKKKLKKDELYAGKLVKAGNHEVLLKGITIEKLQEYLESYSQDECDLFLEFCFKVLLEMSTEEVYFLKHVNLDEDVVLRIASFIMDWNVVKDLLNLLKKDESVDRETVLQIKKGIIDYANVGKVRNHESCTICKGIRYCDKK